MKERDGFKSRTGFVLACIGSAVGMGNIWRFPYIVSDWGGMTFLLPYLMFVVLIASTGVIEEMALGRAAKSGPIKAFGMCTELRTGKKRAGELIGMIPVLGSMALAIGYTVVVGWIFKYAFLALSGNLYTLGQDMGAIGGLFDGTASGFGNNSWLVITVLVTAVIMAFGIAGGIEKANKVMMPLLFVLFLGLGAYIFTLPGSENGYHYIFTIDPAGLKDVRLWIYAFGQAFFSLSIAGNGTVIYGSYLSDSEDIPGSARNVAFFDTLAALLAAFVIIPGMAAGGAELSSGGPGLMFIYLLNVFNGMPGGRICGHGILCLCPVCRHEFPGQSVRGSGGNPAGALRSETPGSGCSDRGARLRCGTVYSGDRIRLDGCGIHLYLSVRGYACGYHVLLGGRKRICLGGSQPRRKA